MLTISTKQYLSVCLLIGRVGGADRAGELGAEPLVHRAVHVLHLSGVAAVSVSWRTGDASTRTSKPLDAAMGVGGDGERGAKEKAWPPHLVPHRVWVVGLKEALRHYELLWPLAKHVHAVGDGQAVRIG